MRRFAFGLVILLPLAVAADEVTLKSGGKFEGIVKRTGEKVVVETFGGEITVPADQVSKIDLDHTSDVEIWVETTEALKDSRDAREWALLGQWAKDRKASKQAQRAFEKALTLDGNNEAARRELGFRWHDGHWITEDEFNAAIGLVKFEGRWISPEERELILKNRAAELEARVKAVAKREAEVEAAERDVKKRQSDLAAAQKAVAETQRDQEKRSRDLDERERKVRALEGYLLCATCGIYHRGEHWCLREWTWCGTCSGLFRAGHKCK